jgi:hypothetical protein
VVKLALALRRGSSLLFFLSLSHFLSCSSLFLLKMEGEGGFKVLHGKTIGSGASVLATPPLATPLFTPIMPLSLHSIFVAFMPPLFDFGSA